MHPIIAKNEGNFGFWDALIRSMLVDSLWASARETYGDDTSQIPGDVLTKIAMWDADLTLEKYVEACMEMQVAPEIIMRKLGK